MSAETDAIYTSTRGVVFAPYSVNVVADQIELAFYVDDEGDVRFLERIPGTWTEHLEKQAARELAKTAPKPKRVPAG